MILLTGRRLRDYTFYRVATQFHGAQFELCDKLVISQMSHFSNQTWSGIPATVILNLDHFRLCYQQLSLILHNLISVFCLSIT